MATILVPIPSELARAAAALRRGDVVAMPTETVYGLAAHAFDEAAVARVFAVKERPSFDPLIVHVSPRQLAPDSSVPNGPLGALAGLGLVDVDRLDARAKTAARALIERFWPGPLTLVLPRGPRVPDLVTSGLETVGLRMPQHSVAQALIDAAGAPLAAPSANRFGRISPTTAAAVQDELGDRIELIVDGGPCEIGVESTVAAITPAGELALLRPGAISADELTAASGLPCASTAPAPRPGVAALSPGQLESHYAPTARFVLLERSVAELDAGPAEAKALETSRAVGLLVLRGSASEAARRFARLTGLDVEALSLSATGRPDEIARALFRSMRALDAAHPEVIFCEPPAGGTGLEHAIADRLRRAAAART